VRPNRRGREGGAAGWKRIQSVRAVSGKFVTEIAVPGRAGVVVEQADCVVPFNASMRSLAHPRWCPRRSCRTRISCWAVTSQSSRRDTRGGQKQRTCPNHCGSPFAPEQILTRRNARSQRSYCTRLAPERKIDLASHWALPGPNTVAVTPPNQFSAYCSRGIDTSTPASVVGKHVL